MKNIKCSTYPLRMVVALMRVHRWTRTCVVFLFCWRSYISDHWRLSHDWIHPKYVDWLSQTICIEKEYRSRLKMYTKTTNGRGLGKVVCDWSRRVDTVFFTIYSFSFLCAGRDGLWFNNFHEDNKERFPFVYQIIQRTIHFSAKHIFNRTKGRKHTGKSQHCWH